MIRVYSKEGCIQCVMAKEFLEERGIQFEYITECDPEKLKQETNQKMFPFIFDGEDFLGGLKELLEKYDF